VSVRHRVPVWRILPRRAGTVGDGCRKRPRGGGIAILKLLWRSHGRAVWELLGRSHGRAGRHSVTVGLFVWCLGRTAWRSLGHEVGHPIGQTWSHAAVGHAVGHAILHRAGPSMRHPVGHAVAVRLLSVHHCDGGAVWPGMCCVNGGSTVLGRSALNAEARAWCLGAVGGRHAAGGRCCARGQGVCVVDVVRGRSVGRRIAEHGSRHEAAGLACGAPIAASRPSLGHRSEGGRAVTQKSRQAR
jgi:hypothetical protein